MDLFAKSDKGLSYRRPVISNLSSTDCAITKLDNVGHAAARAPRVDNPPSITLITMMALINLTTLISPHDITLMTLITLIALINLIALRTLMTLINPSAKFDGDT